MDDAIGQRLCYQRFHRVPLPPEALIAVRERLYLSYHFAQTIQYVGAITSDDFDDMPGAIRKPAAWPQASP